MTERFAIYYAPALSDPLWTQAAKWLGRDPASRAASLSADIPGISGSRRHEITVSARRYGFHATLKPPMALAAGSDRSALRDAMAAFAASRRPVSIGRLTPRLLGGFLALMPEEQTSELTAFAADCVTHFDAFRAPPSSEEHERRAAHGLTMRQANLLDTYGYPYVLEEFRFHMTLTDRLVDGDREEIRAAAQAWIGPALDRDLALDRLVLFHQTEPGAPFMRLEEFQLERVSTA